MFRVSFLNASPTMSRLEQYFIFGKRIMADSSAKVAEQIGDLRVAAGRTI